MNKFCTMLTAIACVAATGCADKQKDNPFLNEYTTEFQIPPFDQIQYQHYLPALEAGIAEHNQNIQAIVANEEAPTFDNTILAMENSEPILSRVVPVFGALNESNNTAEMDSIANIFMPMLTAHNDEVMMNDALFQRIKAIHDNPEGLEPDQKRLTDKYYKQFVRSGALLNDEDKEALKAVNAQLSDLYLKFAKNVLNATNAFSIEVEDSARLAGLPASSVAAAAVEATKRGKEGNWVFTLQAPSRLPLLQYAQDRELRKQMYEGYTSMAGSGEFDNKPIINQILQARATKAKLLGYDNFGNYMTANVMAGNIANAENLLMQIWTPAVAKVKEEVAEMQAYANANGDNITIEPWDYYYYAEKLRQQKYDLDEAAVCEYFQMENVREGVFTMAEKLYGIKFTPLPDAPKYDPSVEVFEVTDAATGEHIAIFMTDYFVRDSKRAGAWMDVMRNSWQNADGSWTRPIVFNVGNFTGPAGDVPSLLTLDEVETMFHEFGHGLQGMLSRVRYNSLAGTDVDRDYVELASQIHEHWALTPELINTYARHYKTGEVIPAEMVEKLEASSTHNQGFTTAELVGAALLDLEYGKLNPSEDIDIDAFEQQVSQKLGMPKELTYRYRSPYFRHIFGSDGYASGYYTYLWAEVLDADGFELFEERGVFDPETAASFKKNVLESGDTEDAMTLFVRFRGHEPSVDALLRNRGLR